MIEEIVRSQSPYTVLCAPTSGPSRIAATPVLQGYHLPAPASAIVQGFSATVTPLAEPTTLHAPTTTPPITQRLTSSAVPHIQHTWHWWDMWAAFLQIAHFLAGLLQLADLPPLFPFFTFNPARVLFLFSALNGTTLIFSSLLSPSSHFT